VAPPVAQQPPGFTPPGAQVAPPPPPAPPPPAAPPEGQKPAGEKPEGDKEKEKDKDEIKDGVRARGGFSVNGGVMFLPGAKAGPGFGFSGRIGVQINHYLSVVYQNTPIVTFTPQTMGTGFMSSAGLKAGFADYNSFLFMVTLFHFFDIGAGPSVDFLAVANESISLGGGQSSSSSGVSAGAHARVAFNIGGVSGNGPRRSGFNIGGDVHPLFTGAGKGLSLTAGFGGEWY
jgi:hypothetical protein